MTLAIVIGVSLVLKTTNLIRFYNTDPMLFASQSVIEARLYGQDTDIIRKGLALPANARILVTKRHYIPNYYLHPRKLYYFITNGGDKTALLSFIMEHDINWILVERVNGVEYIPVGEFR